MSDTNVLHSKSYKNWTKTDKDHLSSFNPINPDPLIKRINKTMEPPTIHAHKPTHTANL